MICVGLTRPNLHAARRTKRRACSGRYSMCTAPKIRKTQTGTNLAAEGFFAVKFDHALAQSFVISWHFYD
jgi:hypothetical protein